MGDTLYVIYEGGWYRQPFKKVHYGLDDAIMHYGIEAFYGDGELPDLENAQCVYDIKEAMKAAGFVTVDDLRTALAASVQREQRLMEVIREAEKEAINPVRADSTNALMAHHVLSAALADQPDAGA